MSSPELTTAIVLCTYNGGRYLREQIDSILAQSHQPDRIFIRDDGSTDNTLSIIDHYKAAHPNLVDASENPTRLGYKDNFLTAIRHALNYDIIFLCDQDDIWRPDKIERMLACFQDEDVVMAFHRAPFMDEHGMPMKGALGKNDGDRVVTAESVEWRASIQGMRTAFRVTQALKEALDIADQLVCPWPIGGNLAHDDFIQLVSTCSGKMRMTGLPLARYRIHQHNTSKPSRKQSFSVRATLKPGNPYSVFRAASHQGLRLGQWLPSGRPESVEAFRRFYKMVRRRQVVRLGAHRRRIRLAASWRNLLDGGYSGGPGRFTPIQFVRDVLAIVLGR